MLYIALTQDVLRLIEKELAASSGAYNYGLARVAKDVARECNYQTAPLLFMIVWLAGDYTMVLSAFEPRHMGSYSLKIEC